MPGQQPTRPAGGSRRPIFHQHHQFLTFLIPCTNESLVGEMVLGLALQVSMALLAPLRGASFHPLEEKLGQVLLQGAALELWLRDFSGVQQIL